MVWLTDDLNQAMIIRNVAMILVYFPLSILICLSIIGLLWCHLLHYSYTLHVAGINIDTQGLGQTIWTGATPQSENAYT